MSYNFNFRDVFNNFDVLMQGVWLTLELSAITMVLGLVLGIVMALLKTWGPRPLRWLASAYVEVIRNTPLLVQLFIVFFGLPSLGLR
ncbi:MAG: transporter permease, partial [Geminicoccaceae bacterium]|nr:transporter permease [Geminicoccaceae bacterium]